MTSAANQPISINPATGEILAQHHFLSSSQIEAGLANSAKVFLSWREVPVHERARCLERIAASLDTQSERLAALITLEMGKPLSQSVAEVKKCAESLREIVRRGPSWLEDEICVHERPKAYVTYRPLGPVLGVMPWNFPFWQVIRFIGPTLLAGNTILLKHAPSTLLCAQALAKLLEDSGLPEGVYIDFPIEVRDVESVIADGRVRGVSLTGSTRAGRAVGAAAGRALKKAVLELGGSDPYVVLDDADLDLAAEKCVAARMLNGGQSCISGKRWIVTKKRRDEFLARTQELLRPYVASEPNNLSCQLGPMARVDLKEILNAQVERTIREGARLVWSGEVSGSERGFYFPATLLTDVNSQMTAAREELFGPVATVMVAKDEEQALAWANATTYGLGAAIFSRDGERAERLARQHFEAGLCFVNDMVRSDARWPFGGIKDSGLGRELFRHGVLEFTNAKTIVIGS